MGAIRLPFLLASLALIGPVLGFEEHEPAFKRESVKHATDPGAKAIPKAPVATTLERLLALRRPSDLPANAVTRKYDRKRISPLETRAWKVNAILIEIVARSDGDYYLVLESANGAKTVAECPPPAECRTSPFYEQIRAVRKQLDSRLKPSAQPKYFSLPVVATGLGYFGRAARGQNGARLMPLVGLRFVD